MGITGTPQATGVTARMPLGELGYAEATADQTGISTVTAVTNASVTVNVGDGTRRIKITGGGTVFKPTSGGNVVGRIREDTTTLGLWVQDDLGANERTKASGFVVFTPSAGSHTYHLTLETSTGTVEVDAATNNQTFILVEDIGGG